MSLTNEEVERVLANGLVLDCPSMRLIPHSSEKSAYIGSGSVSLNDEGFIEVKLLLPHALPIEEALAGLQWPVGEVLGEEYYYSLEAEDVSARIFTAKGLLPMRHSGPGGTVIYAKAWSLILTEDSVIGSDKNYLRVFYCREIRFPANTLVSQEKQIGGKREAVERALSAAKFSSCGIEFQLEFDKAAGTTTIRAHSIPVTFDEKTVNCILDAFAFVTGSIEPWSIIETWTKRKTETQIRGRGIEPKRSRIGPPLSTNIPGTNVWMLFDRYLSFALNDSKSDRPLSSHVRAVIASGSSPLDVEELVLAVSIESLLRSQYSELPLENESIDAQISVATKLLTNSSDLDAQFRERLRGAMQAMKSPRAKDRLMALEKLALIDRNLVRTYGTFRGKSAHGVGVNWADIQSHINQSSAMLVLFYQLIFLRIGYQGSYIDYGSPGYPEKIFEGDFEWAIKESHSSP